MPSDFHKPVSFGGREFEAFAGAADPAAISRTAHETARALLARARQSEDPAVIERLVTYTDEHGIDALAELWARSLPSTLPGALWRIYLVRAMITSDPEGVALMFRRGQARLDTIDAVVAGAPVPATPDEILQVSDDILRGVFAGDFALALERAAAFCRLCASGATELADDQDAANGDRAAEYTTRALRLATIADELMGCARLARTETLD